MWVYHARRLFSDAPVHFDAAVRILVPQIAENQHAFPVTIDARALGTVQRILLFADLNPIPLAIDYTPGPLAQPFVATRIKLDQRTPVRAAVQTGDGVWHVAGEWVDAAGGGCSAPPVSRVKGDWADHLGELHGRAWPGADDTRLRIAVRHPMDTGLVENIPAYNLETLTIADAGGAVLTRMAMHGSVAEDPVFTLLLKGHQSAYAVTARDTSGLEFKGIIPGEGVSSPRTPS
ncbi:quinoprotein dehydrogenase-associated SoxYZ-like carrier [Novosphingobium sp. 1949]|uniref:Quinoprotein dehydrogenase-associated SoxYZ-like carrier n=2 Tax=Novosphingobium organovorum TaxID=2930092 RepID=A0ABT0BCZ0_9SPHN|nr:quinoprotein dehydrogenase-associated SoxYZ-like carrier [Novosphingobium organovorum]MCJ2182654.1 quinoprotein dehydrogenase-associated SoxYZ-like carrier [Novosphingobium organovorum]